MVDNGLQPKCGFIQQIPENPVNNSGYSYNIIIITLFVTQD